MSKKRLIGNDNQNELKIVNEVITTRTHNGKILKEFAMQARGYKPYDMDLMVGGNTGKDNTSTSSLPDTTPNTTPKTSSPNSQTGQVKKED